jgi:hypothetical protein
MNHIAIQKAKLYLKFSLSQGLHRKPEPKQFSLGIHFTHIQMKAGGGNEVVVLPVDLKIRSPIEPKPGK